MLGVKWNRKSDLFQFKVSLNISYGRKKKELDQATESMNKTIITIIKYKNYPVAKEKYI